MKKRIIEFLHLPVAGFEIFHWAGAHRHRTVGQDQINAWYDSFEAFIFAWYIVDVLLGDGQSHSSLIH